MADLPGRSAFEPEDREDEARDGSPEHDGWGSPLPAEYGSLQAVRPAESRGGSGSRPGRSRIGRSRSGEGPSMSALLRRIQGGEPVPATADGPALEGPASDGHDPDVGRAEPVRRAARAAPPAGRRADRVPAGARGPTADRTAPTGAQPVIAGEPLGSRLSRRDRNAARRAARVRSKATVRHIDVVSVVKVSLIFYLIVLLVVVIASVLMWYAADAFGTLSSFEKSIRTLFSLKSFTVHPGTVALYTAAAGLVIAVAGTIANILLAFIYNLIAEVVGGVRVEVDSYPED